MSREKDRLGLCKAQRALQQAHRVQTSVGHGKSCFS
ncbi:Uncharacterised protein [Vibrio cholerae]|nr:Uncharacterised protein [Vibrio cholerae]